MCAIRCPGENEQADRDQEGYEERWNQASFRCSDTVLEKVGVENVVDVAPVCGDRDEHTDGDAEERQSGLTKIEAVASGR